MQCSELTHRAPTLFRAFGHPWLLVTLALLWSLLPSTADACVGPPPEPFCTKTLQLAMAGPPVILLPGGGSFDVSALVYISLRDFPAGFGSCPTGPHTVDIQIDATCNPGGADGSGQLLGAAVVDGYNELTVPLIVPAGPARRCTLTATATWTLSDGMVLTETADNVACLGEPAPSMANRPRLDLRRLGPTGGEILRTHPGDPTVVAYEIINNDAANSFSGTIRIDSLNESRQPSFAGPMPPGTAVVSVSDPLQGDNFPIAAVLGTSLATEGPSPTASCIALPADPANPEIPIELITLELGPSETAPLIISSRHWGMCTDGSCGRSTVVLEGLFEDASPGVACSGFVSAVDTSVPPTYACSDSGEAAELSPPQDATKLMASASPYPDIEIEIETTMQQLTMTVDDMPTDAPFPFSGLWSSDEGRIQEQWVGRFAVDSFFDISYQIDLSPGTNSPPVTVETLDVDSTGAPSGFDSTAPFVSPRVLLQWTDQAGNHQAYFTPMLQFNAIAIDNLGNRRPLAFTGIDFALLPDGVGFSGRLSGGSVEPAAGDELLAIELAMDFTGFMSPEEPTALVFEDGFESGNVSRWSTSAP